MNFPLAEPSASLQTSVLGRQEGGRCLFFPPDLSSLGFYRCLLEVLRTLGDFGVV